MSGNPKHVSEADVVLASSDVRELRAALGRFATGVTVITTRSGQGEFLGLTANSFNALSLDPPLILWSLRLGSASLAAFQGSERFVVNVLTDAQIETSRLFASGAKEKFSRVAHAVNLHGMPFLHDAAAWFECRRVSQQTAGDHCLFIAEIERFATGEGTPLLFHGGAYHSLGASL